MNIYDNQAQTKQSHLQWNSDKSRAVCILLHDFNALPHRFSGMGEYLSRNRIACIAPAVLIPELRHEYEVVSSRWLSGVLELINGIIYEKKKKYKDVPVFLIGEGYGAVIALEFCRKFPTLLAGCIAVAPCFGLFLPLERRLSLLIDFFVRPKKAYSLPIKPSMVTKDQWYLDALKDMGEHDYSYTAKFLGEFWFVGRMLRSDRRFEVPLLMLLASDELIVENTLAHTYFQNLASDDKKINYYNEFHALSVPQDRESVYSDIVAWISSRTVAF